MEAIAIVALPHESRCDVGTDDRNKCIICQQSKFPKKKFPLSKGTIRGIFRVVHCAEIRERYNDETFGHAVARLKGLKDSDNQDVFWHRVCYCEFTNEGHIQRIQKLKSYGSVENEPSTSRRSSLGGMDWSKCMFCQKDGHAVNQVETMATSEKILSKAVSDKVLSYRLAGTSDLIAAEGKYHLKCYSKFQRSNKKVDSQDQDSSPRDTCFKEVMALLENGLSQGKVYSLKTVWKHFSRKIQSRYHEDPGIYRSNKWKDKVEESLGDKVKFVQPLNQNKPLMIISSNLTEDVLQSLLKEAHLYTGDTDEYCALVDDAIEDVDHDTELFGWLYRVALKVHHDIKATPGHDCIGSIDLKSAEKVVPESLFMFISLLCAGDMDIPDSNDMDTDIKMRILSICQDIVFLVSRGRKLTPKHLGLGLTVHQATRSKDLVQLLFAAGHSVSYVTVLRMDNAIANDVLKRYRENGNIFVPQNFTGGCNKCYTRYAVDNIDINEETLSGMGTFHATQFAALQRMDCEPNMDFHIAPKSDRQLNLEIPSELHELQEIELEDVKPEPVLQGTIREDWYTSDRVKIHESFVKDLAWILSRLVKEQPDIQQVPGWSGFNQLFSKSNNSQKTVIGPLPIINAPAHEFETLWTVILKCKAMTTLRRGTYTIVTMDEGLYNKAKMLQWAKTDELQNIIVMLGGFHTQMNFSKVIGQYLEFSGISDMWVESEVFGESTAGNILKGKVWNRVLRAHKLSYEALWRVLWPLILQRARDMGNNVDESLKALSHRLADLFPAEADNTENDQSTYSDLIGQIAQVTDLIDDLDATHATNPTFCYWRKYMHLVSILLRFTRALRDGDWELYLSSFAEMLPWFAAFDHVNYTRWGIVFLADMKALNQTAPEVFKAFQEGDFVTKETHNAFNQISDDQALEHVNRSCKVAGGLVGITRNDSARDRWCLTYNERSHLSEETKAMFNVGGETGVNHKDTRRARIQKDEEDVLKLVSQFNKYGVFGQRADLVAVTTGDIANDDIQQDLLQAEEIGKNVVKKFVQDRLIKRDAKFHDRIKQQKLKTFETLYSVPIALNNKAVSIRADRDLLRRVVVALESGREVDIDTLLQRELAPIPLSLASADGQLRYASSKSDFGNILKGTISQNQAPSNQEKTCTIIDGMAAVQSLANRSGAKTFGEWSDNFLKYVLSHLSNGCTRVDVVFDRYFENSIKQGTRIKRKGGRNRGIRRNVDSREQKIGNWDRFIAVGENKASLANFISTEISRCPTYPGCELVVSGGFNNIMEVWSSDDSREDLSELASNHEEADTRIILHARDATVRGYRQVNVRCRDTDVLVLLLAHRELLCPSIWLFAGTARRKLFIPIHEIQLTDEKRRLLLAFHAITGCDTTSQFSGIGKQSAWKILESCSPELLQHLGEDHPLDEKVRSNAEAFVCKLYSKGTTECLINKVRSSAFRKPKLSHDRLPPTQDALNLHISRANYQTMVWKKASVPCPVLPLPQESGWRVTDDGALKPQLMCQDPVSMSCVDLAFCGCTREGNCCGNQRCTCVRLSLCCSKACKCGNICRNIKNSADDEDER